MPRPLPLRPDIRHLRKEAKRLFLRLHAQAPQAQLADAQFILAAEYGFKSWSRLKAEVERRADQRWAARLAEQESFQPVPAEPRRAPASLQRVWLSRQDQLTEEADMPFTPEPALVHIGFLLLALVIAIAMAAR